MWVSCCYSPYFDVVCFVAKMYTIGNFMPVTKIYFKLTFTLD